MPKRELVTGLEAKIMEAIERADHLISLAPASSLDWRPQIAGETGTAADLGHLLGHLLDCAAGFCAALHAAFPEELAGFAEIRLLLVNHSCPPTEARARLEGYAAHIRKGLAACTDEDLARQVQTGFDPGGQSLLYILLGNLEHFLNHKYQLFFYLKLLGVPVGTPDLYSLSAPSQDDRN